MKLLYVLTLATAVVATAFPEAEAEPEPAAFPAMPGSLFPRKIGGACKHGSVSGTCQKVGNCAGGYQTTGDCPNDPSDVKCCMYSACFPKGYPNGGTCRNKKADNCIGGKFIAGYCPGDETIQCCVPNKLVV